MRAKVENNTVVAWPYTRKALLRDHPNVSFPTTIPEDVLLAHGSFPVIETVKPQGDIVWEDVPVVAGNECYQSWAVAEYTPEESAFALEEAKQRKLERLERFRFDEETRGITVGGLPVKTDRESQSLLSGALAAVGRRNDKQFRWKAGGSYVQLGKAQIEALHDAVTDYVEACREREYTLFLSIQAASTEAEVAAIDTTVGWPEGVS